ncbi:MAG: hypothetical protein LBF71_03955 [Campylobacteraceae bacterium]|nr:hypothetical protein [Campylobacteraceae bacterium]
MDEAAASLDAENEMLIRGAYVLIIAHRRFVEKADKIIILENAHGRGTHGKLPAL